jgi:hypothetical protein
MLLAEDLLLLVTDDASGRRRDRRQLGIGDPAAGRPLAAPLG